MRYLIQTVRIHSWNQYSFLSPLFVLPKSTVEITIQKAAEYQGMVAGPKQLKVFGASYLYPIFIHLGLSINLSGINLWYKPSPLHHPNSYHND